MAEVTLTQAVRASLLSLQGTSRLIEQTQGRLSSGLRVAAAVDDPVSFFQSKGLGDRAFDFQERLNGIDQSISSVTAALDGVAAIETLVRQLKGVAQALKSAEAAQLSDLVSQFADLRTQINELAADSTYQGTNLINGTGTTLSVEFSQRSASRLEITSVDLTIGSNGLKIGAIQAFTGGFIASNATAIGTHTGSPTSTAGGYDSVTNGTALFQGGDTVSLTFEGLTTTYSAGTTLTFNGLSIVALSGSTLSSGEVFQLSFVTAGAGATSAFYSLLSTANAVDLTFEAIFASGASTVGTAFTAGESITVSYLGSTRTFTTADNGLVFTQFGVTGTFELGTGQTLVLSAGENLSIVAGTAVQVQAGANTIRLVDSAFVGASGASTGEVAAQTGNTAAFKYADPGFSATTGSDGSTQVRVGDSSGITQLVNTLDTALTTLRTKASTLGGNVSVLQTRLDFTQKYVNTLEGGAAKLTLADINEEGANLLALQTRQQLGIQALSFAGQAEQSILALFQ